MNHAQPANSQVIPAEAAAPKPLLDGPKRQHFLPRFYLENFSANGFVAVYDREQDDARYQTTINTGVIGHFYTMEDDQGRKRFELEQFLAEFEGKAKPVIDKLAAQGDITADERSDLAIFAALGAMRTPDVVDSIKALNADVVTDMMKKMFANVDDVAARLREDPEFANKPDAEVLAEANLMVYMATNDGMKVTTNHRWAVRMAIQLALDIAPLFAGRDWAVLHRSSEKKSFVTTDAPVFLTTVARREDVFWGIGYGSTDALIIFPLSQSCVLTMRGDSGELQHITAGDENVRQINLAMATHCQRYVIGRDEALVRSLARAASLATFEWTPKMQRA